MFCSQAPRTRTVLTNGELKFYYSIEHFLLRLVCTKINGIGNEIVKKIMGNCEDGMKKLELPRICFFRGSNHYGGRIPECILNL